MSGPLSLAGPTDERPDDRLAAFAAAYLRRPADHDGREEAELAAEVRGLFSLAAGRAGAPAAVRAFTPVRDEHGYDGGSVLETAGDDLPFLVDSVTAVLTGRGHRVLRVVHPIVGTERDGAGALVRVGRPRDLPRRESVMHFDLDGRLAPEELAALEDAVREVLRQVRCVVDDFPAMQERCTAMAGHTADLEHQAFLRWLDDGHFAFLGYRELEEGPDGTWAAVPGSELGLLRGGAVPLRPRDAEAPELVVAKTDDLSPVHRHERMDDVGLLLGGEPRREARLVGLLGSRAYAEPASSTPLLAGKLHEVLEAEDLVEGSHDFKAAVAIFNSFPKDELFEAPAAALHGQVADLLALRADAVRLLLRRSPDGRTLWAIAALPRPSYSGAVRQAVRDLLVQATGATQVQLNEVLGEGERVRLHLALHDPEGVDEVDGEALQEHVRQLARSWDDRLREKLVGAHGEEKGRMLAARWAPRLPGSYKAAVPPDLAVQDVRHAEALQAGARDLEVGLAQDRGRSRVTLYKRGPKVELSRATPMLEHLGLRAIEEQPTRLDGAGEAWIQAFSVLGPDDRPLDLDACGERLAATLDAVYHGETESDALNRLVVTAGLTHRQVQVLRAYRRYRQRLGSRYTESFQNDVVTAHPELTAKLVRLFEARFDPEGPAGEEDAIREEVLRDLDEVALLDHDRILRNQLGAIDATVRTNAYRPGRDALAFKLRSAEVPAIPQPAPLFEIYVYAADMEGVHLRGGRIARGGLRWSDRMDYRTEVYGLMRAQMTKNAVIVPAGAKGGFFLKEPPMERDALRAEVERQYVRYIEALLDVTDDLADDGSVVHPDGVRVRDEDDTYLVVAADKGTATFSDTANAVALRRGFWLGDAFASGGSNGYDHKALGITARGAWEAVKRHFRELGVDPEQDAVTAVGIGDMSGDVFGNGLLLSKTVRLVAAYDHRHVFLDPAPADAQRSWEERKRLFELPGSTWDDYDAALISEGGGVFSRSLKRIKLTPQVREALGVEDEELAPTDLIRAILRAPVDLLFNGGIGTVVKASTESDADAQDRSSDAIRVDARDLRCRVVGEGGNLGLTQRARIEASRHGVLVHADFIDNSAGVDCSDHEVNLKVLLDLAVRRGELDAAARDALLRDVTDDVVAHVLRDSYRQARALAREVQASATRLHAYDDLMAALEADGTLDRGAERLPSAEEMGERRRAGAGLERPELAVLLAYAKRQLTDALLESDLVDEPGVQDDLRDYFPAAVVERFGHLLGEHPLRRELLATIGANELVDALGITFASGLVAERGAEPADVVRAFRIAVAALGARERWAEVEDLDAQLESREAFWDLVGGVDALVGGVTRRLLVHGATDEAEADVAAGREAVAVLEEHEEALRSDRWRERRDRRCAALVQAGVPQDLARRHAALPALLHVPDVVDAGRRTGRPPFDAACAVFGMGEDLHLEWLEDQVDHVAAGTRLQRWAVSAVRDDLLDVRGLLARRALETHPDDRPREAVRAFLEERAPARRRLTSFTRALDLDEAPADLAGLTLAVRHLRALAR